MESNEHRLQAAAYALRYWSLVQTSIAGSGHPTSCLSAADIVATLFFSVFRFDCASPHNPDNDRFILSKGHASALLYSAWKCAGVLQEHDLMTYREFNSVLEGHPTPRFLYSDAATGSLGMGLSIGLGMTIARDYDKRCYTVYVLCGDNELCEGSVWEAVQWAGKHATTNLIVFVDNNGLGQSGDALYDHETHYYAHQFRAFGWHTYTVNGHSIHDLCMVMDQAYHTAQQGPVVIIAHTIKGYGVMRSENKQGFHGKAFDQRELSSLLNELKERFGKEDVALNPDHIFPVLMPIHAQHVRESIQKKRVNAPFFVVNELDSTRHAWGQALADCGEYDGDIMVLDGDVKNSTYTEIFAKKYPERFVQCFIAEQNMMSMAVGLACRGKKPWAATFASFWSRAHDQIRMAAIGNASVWLVGSHAGVSIGADGPSQMGLEDIALMRSVPGSTIVYPADSISAYKITHLLNDHGIGIHYMRTTREQTPHIYDDTASFVIGGCTVLRQSIRDCACIVAAGITVHEALKAYTLLHQDGIAVAVIDLYSVKPLDYDTLIAVARASDNRIITVEDHYYEGGLGEAVTYALRNTGIRIDCLAVPGVPCSGTPIQLRAWAGIDANALIKAVKKSCN